MARASTVAVVVPSPAVSEVLDHLEDYQTELETLMVEKFHIVEKQEIPVQYREVG